jgi:hypothetical protein
MKIHKPSLLFIVAFGLLLQAKADTRRFTYTYEPETIPEGGMEFEQWVTLRTQRNDTVGQENYNAWELREEFEYGVTDRYSVSFYLNGKSESYRDPTDGEDFSKFTFKGISIENRYMLLNPAEKPVGLTLYLEPRFSGDEAEIEEKIILGQRHGKWKWALNFSHATEWEDNLHETEGEVEGSIGLARDLGKHWSLGIEARDHNEIPEYKKWENTAVFVGPAVSYRRDNWWVALSVLPQVYGANYGGEDPDGNSRLELEGHERVNVRLIFSISF